MGILEKIAEIELEMSRTQKNKATNYHLGRLKAQIAKLRADLLDGPGGKGGGAGKGQGWDVGRQGNARVCLIGFPSVGKSTLMCDVTGTESEVAAYEFTTLTCVPGIYQHNGAKIQLLDLPGIIEGASCGKGRGRQVIATAKSCDIVLMVLDATKDDSQKEKLEKELEAVGIRLNKTKPRITVVRKKTGGVQVNSLMPLTHLNDEVVAAVL
eukprot:GHVH01001195.1.p2 GENE.GHVH01001195.1~~GHVH01001195.1.p2  ORF type:complete len:211 (+),score=41.70 GHVH01001195.1:70-702(+)